jgi:DNA-directed RNA polymerase subunit K/omega
MKKVNTKDYEDEEIVLETDDVNEDGELEPEQDINEEQEQQDDLEDDFNKDFDKDRMQDENDGFNDCIDIEEPEINISDVVVDDSKRTSKNKMTRYEFVRIIGERIMQLTKGAKPLIKQNKQSMELSYKEIAIEELKANMIPFKIRRFVKDHYEIWKIEELNKKHLEPLFY